MVRHPEPSLSDHCQQRSIEEKAQSQQYLTPWEEDVVVKFVLHMSNLWYPIRIKFIPSIAFCVTRERLEADKHIQKIILEESEK